jgi:signal peptidase II
MNKKLYQYSFIAIFIFLIDRITKLVALAWCAESVRVINDYLSCEVVLNRGISWGMFHSTADIIFMCVSAIIVAITALLCWHGYRNYVQNKPIFGHVIIIAGSVSNLIDRVLYGGVIDFIILSYNNYAWPVFNIADAAIVCGVFVLIFLDEKLG